MRNGEGKPGLFRVLSLDGGGAKGFYTLGALKEIEGMIGRPLCQRFDLIFGTSTGAIIAALICLVISSSHSSASMCEYGKAESGWADR